jgi:hypothetical protein
MRLGNKLVLGVAGAICFFAGAIGAAERSPQPAKSDSAPCRSHPEMDLAAYAVIYSREPDIYYKTPSPANQFVPKDVVIENKPIKFTTLHEPGDPIRGSVPAYVLPIRDPDEGPYTMDSDAWKNSTFFPNGEVETSPCRVRDPSGKRWLVLRNSEGVLEYYNFDRFKPSRK